MCVYVCLCMHMYVVCWDLYIFESFTYFFILCVRVFAYMYVHVLCMCSACHGQKKVLDLLELELKLKQNKQNITTHFKSRWAGNLLSEMTVCVFGILECQRWSVLSCCLSVFRPSSSFQWQRIWRESKRSQKRCPSLLLSGMVYDVPSHSVRAKMISSCFFFFLLKLVELGSLPSKWEPARLQFQKKIKKGNTFRKQNRFSFRNNWIHSLNDWYKLTKSYLIRKQKVET